MIDSQTLHKLIDRIEQLCGTSITPEAIEELLITFLETLQVPLPTSPTERIILTAFGCDRPGILAEITRTLYEAQVNILDVSQKILHSDCRHSQDEYPVSHTPTTPANRR